MKDLPTIDGWHYVVILRRHQPSDTVVPDDFEYATINALTGDLYCYPRHDMTPAVMAAELRRTADWLDTL